MTWIQVLTIILANVSLCITLFLWIRKESNSDRKELTAAVASAASESRKEMSDFRKMWAQETKEYHARLCVIEERRK